METWMIISLYILQTFTGAILWRFFLTMKQEPSTSVCFWWSAAILPNIIGLFVLLFRSIKWSFNKICIGIDFLAGKKVKKEEIITTENHFKSDTHTTWL